MKGECTDYQLCKLVRVKDTIIPTHAAIIKTTGEWALSFMGKMAQHSKALADLPAKVIGTGISDFVEKVGLLHSLCSLNACQVSIVILSVMLSGNNT